ASAAGGCRVRGSSARAAARSSRINSIIRALGAWRCSVDGVTQALAGLEANGRGGGDAERGAGLRILAFAGGALPALEGAESNQADVLAAAEGVGDFVEDGVERLLRLVGSQVGAVGDKGGQVRFAHNGSLRVCGRLLGLVDVGWSRRKWRIEAGLPAPI